MLRIKHAFTAGLLLLVAACASTPQATAERDREAKRLGAQPGSSTIFVYRSDFPGAPDDTVLWINGRLIGATLPKSFFRIDVNPGSQQLSGFGGDNGGMRLETRPGEMYFIRLETFAGQSTFERMESAAGRRELTACCALLENWRPGQRPLLR
jgi:hypothetical protein